MQINYFEFVNNAWHKLSNTDLSPSHRALFWAIVHRWNQNFFNEFEANRFDLMKLSGIKSDKTYFHLVADLEKADLIKYNRGVNVKSKSSISVGATYVNTTEVENNTYVNFTEVESSTYVKSTEVEHTYVKSTEVETTEVEPVYLGKNYLGLYNDTDISNNTTDNSIIENNNSITIKEKKEKKSEKKSRQRNETTFLESDIGNFAAFSDYIKNHPTYPHASPSFYFESLRDWRDKSTGTEPKRLDWKLVVNTFFRNDISRNGKVVTEQPNGNKTRNQPTQITPAQLENDVDSFLERRRRLGGD